MLRQTETGWLIVIIDETGEEHAAPVGTWFAAQFMTRIVLPSLVLDAAKEPHHA